MSGPKRRLSDKVIDAFDMACDKNDIEVAQALYQVLEIVLTRHGGKDVADNRENLIFIEEANGRLDKLRVAAA